MSVENVTYINHLNPEWPTPADFISEGDDHIRSTKKGLKNSFPNVAGAVTATHGEMNHLVGVTSPIQGQINGKAASTVTADLQTQVNAKADKTTTDDLQTQINAKASQSTADSLQTQINAKAAKAGDTYTGTHDFSGADGVTLPAVTSIGAVTSAEIGRLSGLTAGIQSQLNAKAEKAGGTYSGAHNFSGATVTLAADTAIGAVSSSELQSLDGVTAPIQGQLDGKASTSALAAKQDALVSGTNIKTINGTSVLGSGDLVVTGDGSFPSPLGQDGNVLRVSGNAYALDPLADKLSVGQHGIGGDAAITGIPDCNAAPAINGLSFMGENMANAPGANWWIIRQEVHNANYLTQHATPVSGRPALYVRHKNNGVWSRWRNVDTRMDIGVVNDTGSEMYGDAKAALNKINRWTYAGQINKAAPFAEVDGDWFGIYIENGRTDNAIFGNAANYLQGQDSNNAMILDLPSPRYYRFVYIAALNDWRLM